VRNCGGTVGIGDAVSDESMAKKRSDTDPFKDLTWDDLQAWAGTSIVSRGRSYQRNHHVQGLARTPSGGLVAWVQGTEKYATQVEVEDGRLVSTCTCPYGGTCKHAVAATLEYLESVKNRIEVPSVTERDRRLKLLQELGEEGWIEEEDEYDNDEEEEYEDGDADDTPARRPGKAAGNMLRPYLEQQTQAQLIDLLDELAERFPTVRKALQDRRDLSMGTAKELVKAVRREIRELSAEPGWRNDWNDEGYIPDYSGVRDRLEVLLQTGHADEVVALGKELLEAGVRQVEMSHDEGETGEQIASCLDVVFRALPQSSLSPAEQMLWAVDAELNDDYDLCQGAEVFWEEERAASDWNIVADSLAQRLKRFNAKGKDDFSWRHRRDRLTDWLITALDNAGRDEEIIPLCEQEADKTDSYVRLVNYLKAAGRWEEAEQWIHKGIEATQKEWPGIATSLRDELRQIRANDKDWLRVAAFAAEDFFREPTLHTFEELQKAADKAGVRPAVRTAALRYLETGELPQAMPRATKSQPASAWPLPDTGVEETTPHWRPNFPVTETLIDIAIAESRLDDAIRWYDQHKGKASVWAWSGHLDDKIASAIADSHPDRALAIWKKIAEAQIAHTQPSAYERAAGYLRKIHHLLKTKGREKEWQPYLAELRQAHARKRRLLEILDGLSGRPIVEGA